MTCEQAPLLRGFAAEDAANGRWLLLILAHHLALDHTTLELLVEETELIDAGRTDELPTPVPFRNFVAQARLGVSREEHEAFFRKMLGDIDEPTAPFGLLDVQGDGTTIAEAQHNAGAVAVAGAPRVCAAIRSERRELDASGVGARWCREPPGARKWCSGR